MNPKNAMLATTLFLVNLSYGQITNPSPYCAAGYDDGGGGPVPHYISNVTLGSLNNTSGDTQFAAPHYVYYNNLAAPNLVAGNTYTLSVSHDPVSIQYVAVYIDYNQNNSFYDPGERVLQQTEMSLTVTNPSVASLTIPATAKQGITRMRVMVFEDDTYTSPNATPCTADATGYLNWGETEDYNVKIIPSTGITEINKSNADIFYPNPSNGAIYVSESMIGSEIAIFNIEGKLKQHSIITNKKIDISNMAPGQYIIKAISNNNVYSQHLTVIKQ